MKKVLASSVVVLMVLFLSAGLGLARNGQGGGGIGGGGGACSINVLDGTPFTVAGNVVGTVGGGGVLIAPTEADEFVIIDEDEDGVETATIYGIGPVRYWDLPAVVVDRPDVPDEITVSGFVVDYNGVLRNIAMYITTIDGVIVQLRDPVTGVPLWRQ